MLPNIHSVLLPKKNMEKEAAAPATKVAPSIKKPAAKKAAKKVRKRIVRAVLLWGVFSIGRRPFSPLP